MSITLFMVEQIKALCAVGESQRDVAKLLRISRGTVADVVNGRERKRKPAPDDGLWHASGPIGRCPTCGGMVYLPCMLCEVRKVKRRDRLIAA